MGDNTRVPKVSIVNESGIVSSEVEEPSTPRPRIRRISRSPSPRRVSRNEDVELPHFEIYKYNKDTVFNTGEGVCGKCNEKIFLTEKVWGPGEDNPWHKDCLKCTDCKKQLDSGSMQEDQGDPYCSGCFNKIKGSRLGLL